MALREQLRDAKPLEGARIMGSLHMTIQTAVLIETLDRARRRRALGVLQHLLDPGPRRRGGRRRPPETGGHRRQPAAASPVFAWKGETLEEYWWCTDRGARLARRPGPDPDRRRRRRRHAARPQGRRVREGRQGAGVRRRARPRGVGRHPRPAPRASSADDPTRWRRSPPTSRGVSEETTTGVHRLYEMTKAGTLLFPAINVNDSVTKTKFDNIYGCRHSLTDGLLRATDVMLAGKVAVVCGYRRGRQGLRRRRCAARAPAWSSPRSTRSARCRRRWRATRSPRSTTWSRPPTSSSPPPATTTSSPPSTWRG